MQRLVRYVMRELQSIRVQRKMLGLKSLGKNEYPNENAIVNP